MSPIEGPIAGGTVVTVRGANLLDKPVMLDDDAVTVASRSDTEIRVVMPKHDNGYAVIRVGDAAAEYLYIPPRLEELPPGYVTTMAGVGAYLRLGLPATRSMVLPWGLTVAPDGTIYFAQAARNLILRVGTDGILRRVAGSLRTTDIGGLGDGGPALDAFIGFPRSVSRDAAGNLYVGDSRARLRKIDAVTGIISTIAGTGTAGFSGDGGPATQAQITQPTHVFSTPDGTVYFLDDNVRVRKVTPDGTISTVAGNGTVGQSGDGGLAIHAQLNSPFQDAGDLAVDSAGNLYILELEGARVRKVDAASGIISTFVSRDARGQRFIGARGIAIDPADNIYVASALNIAKFDRAGRLITSWGVGPGFSEDGTHAAQALLGTPRGLAIAPNGDIIYSEFSPTRLRRINIATGRLETVAGMSPNVIGVPGRAIGAVLSSSWGDLAFLPTGDLLIGDGSAKWIFRIDRSGMITPFAGTGGSSGPGRYEGFTALATDFSPVAIETDADGIVYVADKMSIRSIDATGLVQRLAGDPLRGNQGCGFTGDGGPARDALLCQPNDLALDRHGNIFIADTNNNRIRRIDRTTGIITTVAGSGATNGFEGYGRGAKCGDGGPAVQACLNTPIAVAVRADDSMYIADYFNDPPMRKVTADGTIASVARAPVARKLIVGPGQGVLTNGYGMFRIDDDRIRSIAGNGKLGFGGDGGPASEASFASGEAERAQGIAVDHEGNLFLHDSGNRRIRAVRYGAVVAPSGTTVQLRSVGMEIVAAVRTSDGHAAPGVRINFDAPSPGPSCVLSAPFAISDITGTATVTCIPNCLAGTYRVTAQPLTLATTATVALSNPGGPCRRRAARH